MKDHILKYYFPFALALSIAYAPGILAEVYKTVDKDGNVVYTDQAPGPDAEALVLRGLSVISPQVPASSGRGEPSRVADPIEEPQQEVTSIRDLRRGYRDFAIISPTQDQSFIGTGNRIGGIVWSTEYRLQPGMMVTVYLDGAAQPPTTNPAIEVGRLSRGTHEVYAELIDARNRRIAVTNPVTFHVLQPSVNFPNRRPGGG